MRKDPGAILQGLDKQISLCISDRTNSNCDLQLETAIDNLFFCDYGEQYASYNALREAREALVCFWNGSTEKAPSPNSFEFGSNREL